MRFEMFGYFGDVFGAYSTQIVPKYKCENNVRHTVGDVCFVLRANEKAPRLRSFFT